MVDQAQDNSIQQDQTQPQQPSVDNIVPWSKVMANPEYQKLNADDKEAARNQYYQEVVDPHVPDQYKDQARQQFDASTQAPESGVKKALDIVNAPFEGFQKGVNNTILGTIQGGAQLANKVGLTNSVGDDIQKAMDAEKNDKGNEDYYKDNSLASGLNTVGEGAEKVGEFATLAGKTPGMLRNAAAGAADEASQPAQDLTDRTAHAALGAGAGVVGSMAGDAMGALFPDKTVIPTAKQMRDVGSNLYQMAADKGGTLSPAFTDNFINTVKNTVLPQTAAGKAISGDNTVTQVIKGLDTLKGKPLTLADAQELDEQLGNHIDNFVDNGKLLKEGSKLYDIQSTLRNMINNAQPSDIIGGKEGFDALSQARGAWSTSAKLRDVEKIIARADQYDNPATALRTGFRTLANNENRMRGWSPEERELVKQAAETSNVTDMLKILGSRLNPIIAMAHGVGPVGSAAVMAGSYASRGLAGASQMTRANNVAKLVATGQKPARGLLQTALPEAVSSGVTTATDENEDQNGPQ